jgi:hypothetical protein
MKNNILVSDQSTFADLTRSKVIFGQQHAAVLAKEQEKLARINRIK